jgi:glutathione S-transferase
MLKLYIANKNYSSWSLRAWVLMRELHIPFDEVLMPFGVNAGAGSFSDFSPTGKVPCLVDGSRVVWDSLAITEYLAERVSNVWPAGDDARAWARCAAAEMHSGFAHMRETCTMNCGLRVRIDSYSLALRRELQRLDELWNQGLSRFDGPYLAGQAFSAADAFFAPVAFRVQTYALPLSSPAQSYAAHLLELSSMREWYASALAETWRDDEHEQEARRVGVWVQDLRATAG